MPRVNYNRAGALLFLAGMMVASAYGQERAARLPDTLANFFADPPAAAKPWVLWYWMQPSVSKEAIRADLEIMKSTGIGGAYIIPVKGSEHAALLRWTVKEADRSGLILHVGEGYLKSGKLPDSISGAPVHYKPVVQAEALTGLEMAWYGYADSMKTRQDRNYALGINRLLFHIFIHHPRKEGFPERTLDGVGLYFQKDAAWWKPTKAWIDYTHRCEWLLQQGTRVADIVAFTGEDLPRHILLPDQLVSTLPGIFGKETVAREAKRLANKGEAMSPAEWVDPLHGYAYDCMNPDVLLRLATVDKGQVVLPGGGRYGVLVLPGASPLSLNPSLQSAEVAERVLQLVQDGATVLINESGNAGRTAGNSVGADRSGHVPGLLNAAENDERVAAVYRQLLGGVFRESGHSFLMSNVGKGRVIKGPFRASGFEAIGLEKDLIAMESDNQWAGDTPPTNDTAAEIIIPVLKKAIGLAYTHRAGPAMDIYFVSNQQNKTRIINLSLRVSGKQPELWNAVTGEITRPEQWSQHGNRTVIPVRLEANGSLFIVFRRRIFVLSADPAENRRNHPADGENVVTDNIDLPVLQTLHASWTLRFDTAVGGPAGPMTFDSLQDWSRSADSSIRYYSGTAVYTQAFDWKHGISAAAASGRMGPVLARRVWLDLGHVANIARVLINGTDCGVAWTPPYRVEITQAIKPGNNVVTIEVTNTWANRLMGDSARHRLDGPLLEAGLLGPVTIRGMESGR